MDRTKVKTGLSWVGAAAAVALIGVLGYKGASAGYHKLTDAPVPDLQLRITTDPIDPEVGDLVLLDSAGSTADRMTWLSLPAGGRNLIPIDNGKRAIFCAKKAGEYDIILFGADSDELAYTDRTIVVGTPEPPVPPGPIPPGPVPPGPTPPPIPTAGFRVLIVYESADVGKLPEPQRQIFTSTAIREYLNTHAAKNSTGHPEWRLLDKNADLTNESDLWKDAWSKADMTHIPSIAVSNGKEGFAGPLPATVDETLALLKKYGGT
jgi:hypothetical protein